MSFNASIFFGVLIGIVAYIMLYIGKGIQKYAIEGLKVEKSIKSKHSGVWIFGLVLTALFLFVQWIPLSLLHTPMNLIAPLEGIGLVSLLIFSIFVLKEKITILEGVAIALIILGTVLINITAITPEELQRESLNFTSFWLFLGITTAILLLLFFVFFKQSDLITGIILGLAAGSCMAFETLAKRITDVSGLEIGFIFVTLLFALLTLALTQYALVKAKANIVIPCFTSASIILTTLLGVYVIDEGIFVIQIVGIGIIVLGIILMNIRLRSKDEIINENVEKLDTTDSKIEEEKMEELVN